MGRGSIASLADDLLLGRKERPGLERSLVSAVSGIHVISVKSKISPRTHHTVFLNGSPHSRHDGVRKANLAARRLANELQIKRITHTSMAGNTWEEKIGG